MSTTSKPLVEAFKSYFRVELASTSEQKEKVFRIRYRVYCEEFSYESPDCFPEKKEFDEYDNGAQHCLIIHNASGMSAGCVRMVPKTGGENSLLPLEKYCASSLDNTFLEQLNKNSGSVCEISRIAVDSAFRRRAGESSTRFGDKNALDVTQQEKRSFSLIAVSAFLAATALTEMSGRTNVFAMMEPFMPRLLKRSGIEFQRAGKNINYHGVRAPYFIRTEHALQTMLPDLKALYDWIYVQIKTNG